MKQILKQFFVIIITFVLVFAISIPCLASDNTHGGGGASGGYRDWSQSEKEDYWRYRAQKYFARLAGVDEEVVAKRWLDKLHKVYGTEGCASLEEYLVKEVSYDEDTDCFVPSENLTVVVNNLLQEENDTVTMVYRYPLNKANIDPSEFASKVWYDTFCNLLDAFPDYYFYFNNTTWMQGPGSNINDGSKSYSYYCLFAVKDPFAGVNSYPDLMTTPVYLYNQDWSDAKNVSVILVMSTDNFSTRDNIYYLDRSSFNGNHNGLIYSSLDDFKNAGIVFEDASSSALSMCNQFSWKRGVSSFTAYSAKTTPINVYKTVADMKKDIGSQVIGGYTPDYTGKCAPSVSVEVINNIGNDDSGGGSGSGGSGSDDSGSSSGIFGGLAKIVGAIVNGIASIIDAIVAPIERIISSIVGLFKDFIDAIMSFADLYDSNIPLFFKDVFSFLPDKLVTVLTTSLILVIIVAVIKFLRG